MLNKQLLNVKDLYVDVEDKEILHWRGSVHW